MILYFDNYITDMPLVYSRDKLKENIRKKCKAYAMPKKIDIAKYVLASYALYPWSYVLVRYELEDPKNNKDFDRYIKSIFPKAHIIHKRSATQEEYKKSIEILEKQKDNWIFYSPNSDHPMISPDPKIFLYIDKLIKKAEKWKKKYKHVSIMYSHFSEFLNIPIKGNPENFLHGRNTKILEDNDLARVYVAPKGDFASVQITHKDLLKEWFSSVDLGNKRVIRAEDAMGIVEIKDQVVIAPKKEICAHFDGYEHMLGTPNEILIDRIPPLFIPEGFFENKIKIAYGYDSYREGWVNISPLAKKYSFRDNKNGTDLKICLEDIPFFWKRHIFKIDINKNINKNLLEKAREKNINIKSNPWAIKNQGINKKSTKFWIRYLYFVSYIKLRMFCSLILRSTKIRSKKIHRKF